MNKKGNIDVLHVSNFSTTADMNRYLEEIFKTTKPKNKELCISFPYIDPTRYGTTRLTEVLDFIQEIETNKLFPYEKIGYKVQVIGEILYLEKLLSFVKQNQIPLAIEITAEEQFLLSKTLSDYGKKIMDEFNNLVSKIPNISSYHFFGRPFSFVSFYKEDISLSYLENENVKNFMQSLKESSIPFFASCYEKEHKEEIRKILYFQEPYNLRFCTLKDGYGPTVRKYNKVKNNPKALQEFSIRHRVYYAERKDYIDTDTYFMALARLSSMRSKDPILQAGACIVKDNIVLSEGYNGASKGIEDIAIPWNTCEGESLETKYPYMCSAEENAIFNFKGSIKELEGATMYVNLFPSVECAKMIVKSGIKEIVCLSDNDESESNQLAKYLLEMGGVTWRIYEKEKQGMIILDLKNKE